MKERIYGCISAGILFIGYACQVTGESDTLAKAPEQISIHQQSVWSGEVEMHWMEYSFSTCFPNSIPLMVFRSGL